MEEKKQLINRNARLEARVNSLMVQLNNNKKEILSLEDKLRIKENLITEYKLELNRLDDLLNEKLKLIEKLSLCKEHSKLLCDCINSILDRFSVLQHKDFPNLSKENMVDTLCLAIKNYVDIWLLINT